MLVAETGAEVGAEAVTAAAAVEDEELYCLPW